MKSLSFVHTFRTVEVFRIHLIAVGGSIMHNLALALHQNGHVVTGSDDEIYDPAKSRLAGAGLIPEQMGWDTGRITADIDMVILGMHAKDDNPELARARELDLRILSFPEFMYEHSRNKQRIVIAGSHGKTTITSMVMHVMKEMGRDFDYMVGAQVQGFDTMVRLSDEAPVIILEGDEYLTSTIDRRPKFLVYKPHICLISGIAWDHINVFPTLREYTRQFELLVRSMPKAGVIVFNDEDRLVKKIVRQNYDKESQYLLPYKTPESRIRGGKFEVRMKGIRKEMNVIGKHNLSNIAGAWEVCSQLSVGQPEFLDTISQFRGAANRLEKIYEDESNIIFKDFAHSPSKVMATVEAIRELFGKRNIIACLELHTFSSLNKKFLKQYRKTLKSIRQKVVFVNQHTLKMKKYPPITRAELVEAFDDDAIEYAMSAEDLVNFVRRMKKGKNVLLMMSSGNFADLDLKSLASI